MALLRRTRAPCKPGDDAAIQPFARDT